MLRAIRPFLRASAVALSALTVGYTWTVGQSGLASTNGNLCELWDSLGIAKFEGCQIQYGLLALWIALLAVAGVYLLYEIFRFVLRVRQAGVRRAMLWGFTVLFAVGLGVTFVLLVQEGQQQVAVSISVPGRPQTSPDKPTNEAKPSPTQTDISDRPSFVNEVVYIADLVRRGAPVIADKTFTRSVIVGPAFLKMQANNKLLFLSTEEPEYIWTVIAEGSPAVGSILLVNVTFRDCYFTGVAMIGTPGDRAQDMGAFAKETRAAWEQRVGFTGAP